jgi:hypothetical protein
MELVVILLLVLKNYRKRSYTPEQLEEIKRSAAAREGRPYLEAPRKPYRWWRYSGLF